MCRAVAICACTCVRETLRQWDMERDWNRVPGSRDAERWGRDMDRKGQGHRNVRLFGY